MTIWLFLNSYKNVENQFGKTRNMVQSGTMKIELETIPVWDGLRSGSECFVCDLMGEAEKYAISYYLGNSVMNPETRVKVNEHGFCPSHYQMLLSANKPQGLALMTDTYLAATQEKLKKSFNALLEAKPGRKTQTAIANFSTQLNKREEGCLICTSMQGRLIRYCFTIAYLWNQDAEFKQALAKGKGFCLHHFQKLLEVSSEALSGSSQAEFVKAITELELANLNRIGKDVWWMTQKYKSENYDASWNGCEDAHKRGVDKITGKSRVIDPLV
jgi:hypothetical protein